MSSYLVHFAVYAFAMVGLLFLCLLVFKKTMINNRCAKNNSELFVENALNLSQRKTLYVVKAGEEKFLIAADAERTSFLAKLGEKTSFDCIEKQPAKNPETIKNPDYSEVLSSIRGNKTPVLKEMMKKLNALEVQG